MHGHLNVKLVWNFYVCFDICQNYDCGLFDYVTLSFCGVQLKSTLSYNPQDHNLYVSSE